MATLSKQHHPDPSEEENQQHEKSWENPVDPESAGDEREIEQLERQKKEAERRHDNLSDNDKK